MNLLKHISLTFSNITRRNFQTKILPISPPAAISDMIADSGVKPEDISNKESKNNWKGDGSNTPWSIQDILGLMAAYATFWVYLETRKENRIKDLQVEIKALHSELHSNMKDVQSEIKALYLELHSEMKVSRKEFNDKLDKNREDYRSDQKLIIDKVDKNHQVIANLIILHLAGKKKIE